MIQLVDVIGVPWMRTSAPMMPNWPLPGHQFKASRPDDERTIRCIFRPESITLLPGVVPLLREHDLDDVVGAVTVGRDSSMGWRFDATVDDESAANWCRSSKPPAVSIGMVVSRSDCADEPYGDDELATVVSMCIVYEVSLVSHAAFDRLTTLRPRNIVTEVAA